MFEQLKKYDMCSVETGSPMFYHRATKGLKIGYAHFSLDGDITECEDWDLSRQAIFRAFLGKFFGNFFRIFFDGKQFNGQMPVWII